MENWQDRARAIILILEYLRSLNLDLNHVVVVTIAIVISLAIGFYSGKIYESRKKRKHHDQQNMV